MLEQLQRMRTLGCNGGLCKEPDAAGRPYRFPHCAMFLRPTDALQNRNSKLISSGLHIPLCVADVSWEGNNRGGQSIRRAKVEGKAVSHLLFEDLFHNSFLGSDKVPVEELEKLYRTTGLLDADESIILQRRNTRSNRKSRRRSGGNAKPVSWLTSSPSAPPSISSPVEKQSVTRAVDLQAPISRLHT